MTEHPVPARPTDPARGCVLPLFIFALPFWALVFVAVRWC